MGSSPEVDKLRDRVIEALVIGCVDWIVLDIVGNKYVKAVIVVVTGIVVISYIRDEAAYKKFVKG